MAQKNETIAVSSHSDSVHHLVSALESCEAHDIYWSNEHFYRWMNGAQAAKMSWLSVFAPRAKDISIEAVGCKFVIQPTKGRSDHGASIERMADDARFPGAAVALARQLAKRGRAQDALDLVKGAYARIESSKLPWDFHILRNQMTALEFTLAGKAVSRALQRYLGDDDGYLAERTCPFPFENLYFEENGKAGMCCAPWMPGFSLGNVISGKETASQLYNNERSTAARRSVLDGSFRFCDHQKCRLISGDELPIKAKITAPDYRMASGGIVGEKVKRAVATGQLTVESPEFVLLAFDQSCNLSCPSCRTRVITEKIDLQITKETLIEESIIPLLKRAVTLNINPAGELFVSRPLRRLLSRLNRQDFPNLKLDIISNGMLFTKREWEKFPGIHEMVRSVRVSTDGATKETFETLRRGATWEIFIENMRFLGDLRQSGVLQALIFSFTYQKTNFREMPLFVDWTRGFDPNRHVVFERLDNWGAFSPENYRDIAIHHIDHPLHSEFLSIIRQPKLKPNPPDLTGDYSVFI
jgi:hypothetical protein